MSAGVSGIKRSPRPQLIVPALSDGRYELTCLIDGPIADWRFTESAGIIARENFGVVPGIYIGGPRLNVLGPIRGETLNKAVILNGSTQFITIPNSSWLDIGDIFTLEAWIKLDVVGGGIVHTIFSKDSNGYMFQINSSGQLYLEKEFAVVMCTSTVSINDIINWHHCVCTKNGNTVKLYLDGIDVTGTVTTAAISNTTSPLDIGRRRSNNSAYLNGSIARPKLYNSALAAARVLAHYNARF